VIRQKVLETLAVIVFGITGAVLCDLVWATVLRHQPLAQWNPWSTVVIAAVVTAPAAWFLVSQRVRLQQIKDELSAALAVQERTRAEAETAYGRLRDSEALYRLLADNQTEIISLWSGSGGARLYASPSAERAFGFTIDELMSLPDSANAHPDDLPIIRELIGSLKPGGAVRSAEYRLMHRDGTALWVEGAFRRLDDGEGTLLSSTRIITERRRLQEELVAALEEAQAAARVKADFLANMTHELRTPLNAIVGFSGLLKESETLHPRDARPVELIHDASQTLLGVVNDVLDFSRLEAGAVEFDAHPFDPAALAENAAVLLSGQAHAKGLSMSVDISGPRDILLGDGARLRQVLLNFLSNAVKFTTRGEIVIAVRQSEEDGRRRLRIAVADSGIGVPEAQRDSIFDRFTQSDASVSRKFGGTGLGLAISKRIVEGLGGTIGVDSVTGHGSTFWFEVTFPLANAQQATAATDAPHGSELAPALRLLLVDDNAVNRELVCALLSPFDIVIDTAADGVEAVEMAGRFSYDLILMDVQMPNMDGLAATRRIRAEAGPGLRRIPIVAMTANVLDEQVQRCLDAGMDDHLGKPIETARLIEAINRWTADGSEADPATAAAG
jgi:PAS domain S-box-containing protein